ncbi:MAG: WecB/TagA/CpsF family glycosyltransferase [Bacillota bacterium]|nr:WecB/TagA/CpsF family glycosyltransferase [Bacillota bacterium]
MMNKISILGVKVNNIKSKEVEEVIKKTLKLKEKKIIFTPNTEIIMMCQKDLKLRKIINSGDLVTPDGIGLIYASKIYKAGLEERVTGFDLSMKLLELSKDENYKVFFLGGKPGVAKRAKSNLESKGYRNIIGYHHGYFFNDSEYERIEENIINQINKLGTNILFVGFGSPKQEKWINKNIQKINANIIIGNGGTIDVLAGEVNRAPDIYQKLGLEWLYRLIQDPKRIKRQISIPKFLIKIIFSKNSVKNL